MGHSGGQMQCGNLATVHEPTSDPNTPGDQESCTSQTFQGWNWGWHRTHTWLLSDSGLLSLHSHSLELFITRMDKPLG